MKPSQYSVLIIPDNEEGSRQFSISRKKIVFAIIGFILLGCLLVLFLVYAIPRLKQYRYMESANQKYTQERIKMMELVQDLNRIEQMDRLIRKTLGSELNLSTEFKENDSTNINKINTIFNNSLAVSYIENIPSKYPVEGFITRKMDISKIYQNQNHYGLDIAVKENEPIYASASGFVVFAGWTYDFGNYVILYHGNDYFTVYGHNKSNFVNVRDFVKRGDVIAASGSTGITSGPHLHYEIWKNGKAVNPLEFFPKYKKHDLSVNQNE